jgi:TonB family protein
MNDNRNRQYMWILMFVVLLTGSGTIASAQVQIELKPNEKSPTKEKPNVEDHRTIPAASLSCTSEEAKWWNAVRTTSEAVRRSRGNKTDRNKFAELLLEGRHNSFTVPIADRKVIVLSQTEPQYTEEARRKRVGGFIGLRLEVLADGTVGKVRTLNSLGSGLDENAIEAARKLVFLPAVKDRKFVDAVIQLEMSFNIY